MNTRMLAVYGIDKQGLLRKVMVVYFCSEEKIRA